MRVAIIHYHLRPGGVTRVIQNTMAAVSEISGREAINFVVLGGEAPTPTMPVSASAIVQDLGYSSSINIAPKKVLSELKATAKQVLGGRPDLWHIHNHALGKNLIGPAIVDHLAREGERIVLQPHDFAEDGRPDNYTFLCKNLGEGEPSKLGKKLYPQGTHVHYALINQRDLRFLRDAGVQESQLHYLPNAVSTDNNDKSESPEQSPFSAKTIFYPVRAIRRKNLGEFLLWAAMAEEGENFAVARSPQNPVARPIYDNWVSFAKEFDLPVNFGIGEIWQGNFMTLLRSAHALLSTSVAEGFGLAFLEPWLAKRPLVGRKLPEITNEFEREGIDLSLLYTRLGVPLDWIGYEPFSQEIRAAFTRGYSAYGREATPQDVERAVTSAIIEHSVDFGKLNERLQQAVIRRIVRNPSLKHDIVPENLSSSNYQETTIYQNCEKVTTQFHLKTYGERLLNIYQCVLDSEVRVLNELRADILLDRFLAPERFSLLRT